MPPVYRIIEVCIYALLNFLPFMLLALYPFWKNLRFSDVTTAILIVLLTIVQIWLGIWAAFFSHGNTGLISVASTALYAIFYFFAINVPVGKTLFTLLMTIQIPVCKINTDFLLLFLHLTTSHIVDQLF